MFAVLLFHSRHSRPLPNSAIRGGRLVCLTALLLFLPTLSHAATLRVPSVYANLRDAINHAMPGDTILVADGTYSGTANCDLEFRGNSLTIKSENGPTHTFIDCGGTSNTPHRAFYIHQHEPSVDIEGFTIENGYGAGEGGGIYVSGNDVTIKNCVFSGNITNTGFSGVANSGAGLFINAAGSATVEDCAFNGNTSQGNGGGFYIEGHSLSATRCTFDGNTAADGGGGATRSQSATLTQCIFSNNTGGYGSGGASVSGSNTTVTHCEFRDNQAYGHYTNGGGAGISGSNSATVIDCSFNHNTSNGDGGGASGAGGGVFINGRNTLVMNCAFSGNTANGFGGGNDSGGGAAIYGDVSASATNCTFTGNSAAGTGKGGAVFLNANLNGAALNVTNCSFYANTSAVAGGAIYTNSPNTGLPTIKNCVAWGDIAPEGTEVDFKAIGTITPKIDHCDIQGGVNSVFSFYGNFDIQTSITADPKFVNASTGDLHLQDASPCVGAGTPDPLVTTDKDGTTRPAHYPSIGAYEIVYAVQGLTLRATSVYGGASTTGTVTLDKPAPTDGTIVMLSSSNTNAATVLESVTVPAGHTQATFTVTTQAVSTYTSLMLTATAGGVSATAILNVSAPVLSTFTLAPATLPSGYQTTASVTLSSLAPAGGLSVLITSGTYTLGSVSIAAGATTGTLRLTAGAPGTYLLTATFGGVSKNVQLTVTAGAALSLVSLSPSSVYGGQSSTGTVRLTLPAPPGGVLVSLSSNTGYGRVPTSVTVPAGATSQTFTVTTSPVTAFKGVTITARASGVSKTAALLIYPPALEYLTLSPTTVKGGHQNSTGTITLTSAAPAGGTVVSLSSNTGYALVPVSMTVPAGSRTASFTVTTRPVTAAKSATITAAQGGVSKSVGLLLTP